jgi:hypothetical protein
MRAIANMVACSCLQTTWHHSLSRTILGAARCSYHKNLRNKNVGNYGKADLAAILGHRA